MNIIFNKPLIIVYTLGMITHLSYGAETAPLLNDAAGVRPATVSAPVTMDPVLDLRSALNTPTQLSFPQCTFDFSNPVGVATSVFTCLTQLVSAQSTGALDPLQVAYIVSEVFAGYVRAHPSSSEALNNAIANPSAMYSAWGQGSSVLQATATDLSSLRSVTTASALVNNVITNDIPILLTILKVPNTEAIAIEGLLEALEPAIIPTLVTAYTLASKAAQVGEEIANKIEAAIESGKCCSCFGNKGQIKGLQTAVTIARNYAAPTVPASATLPANLLQTSNSSNPTVKINS